MLGRWGTCVERGCRGEGVLQRSGGCCRDAWVSRCFIGVMDRVEVSWLAQRCGGCCIGVGDGERVLRNFDIGEGAQENICTRVLSYLGPPLIDTATGAEEKTRWGFQQRQLNLRRGRFFSPGSCHLFLKP